ncbi:hypothetical protein NUU61_003632 [Penicillium alfredii]|uniref:Uncharacterized protein n=1 Tax=Penicillium alfredii TaxID=1506179 RepID=A0A9W9FJQ3_9EURO|nr:uncharacterized protein NUU61_003632 [Penicillium alfredii]KAJ5101410.1 hypothetical protein NUU61_003632 [Penicillium alfredii]
MSDDSVDPGLPRSRRELFSLAKLFVHDGHGGDSHRLGIHAVHHVSVEPARKIRALLRGI